jgi:glycine dehydrogenase subunit 1
LEVIKTYLCSKDIELVIGNINEIQDGYAGILYQTPNYYGEIIEKPDVVGKTLLIACVDLTSLALLEPPKTDIMVGDFQTLGIPTSFGGPYGGFMTCKDEYKRQLPGRIVGKTKDKEGNDAYVLTLQAREQHIRREKATSNICSNQALSALCANLYLDLVGEDFVKIAETSAKNAHALSFGLIDLGYKILNDNFVNEFVLKVDDADKFLDYMKENNILAGIKIDDNKILVATTELNSEDDIKQYLKCAKNIGANLALL